MSAWWAAATVAVPTVTGLLWRWVELRFLHRVYERGGAKDLEVAAEALRVTRSRTLTEKLPLRRDQRER